jgi:hypothetical protein
MQRRWANATFSGFAIIGFLGSVFIKLLDAIGRVQTAKSIYDLTSPGSVAAVAINWRTINFYLFVLSVVFLIAINFDLIVLVWLTRREAKQRTWNEALIVAANKVASQSNTQKSFNYANRFIEAVQLIEDLARNGQITIAGNVSGKGLVPISRKQWKTSMLVADFANPSLSVNEIRDVWLAVRGDPHEKIMGGLMVDYAEIHGAIP